MKPVCKAEGDLQWSRWEFHYMFRGGGRKAMKYIKTRMNRTKRRFLKKELNERII